jgi:hypothetical protein
VQEVSSYEVGSAKAGEGAVRRKLGVQELTISPYPGVTTLYENFQYVLIASIFLNPILTMIWRQAWCGEVW